MPAWKKLVSWLAHGWNARPSVAEARQGMDEFLEAARLSNCELNPAMATGLGGRP
jgi:hypothetical protein